MLLSRVYGFRHGGLYLGQTIDNMQIIGISLDSYNPSVLIQSNIDDDESFILEDYNKDEVYIYYGSLSQVVKIITI